MTELRIPNIKPRHYQLPVFRYFDDTTKPGLRAVDCWARRMGKDLTYMSVAAKASYQRRGMYVHFLPEFAHARRAIWDGFTIEGERLIDVAFPKAMRSSVSDHEMRIEFTNGSTWQLGGSDQYDRWVGSNPIGLSFSEFALAQPKAWEIMRPILKMNGGWASFFSTPRGRNHFYQMLQLAQREPSWHASHISAIQAGVMTQADIDEEVRLGMPEELAAQEYGVDFSVANLGAILGRYMGKVEAEGRLSLEPVWDMDGGPIVVSSDIGFRDTAAFWFWQRKRGGFSLVDYDEDNGLDAEEWIDRLRKKPWVVDTLWLPHDARAKTFQSRHTVVSQFIKAQWAENVRLAPAMKSQDKINAARSVLSRCDFDAAACAQGILTLQEWSYKYDEERKTFSKEPDHNWASHGADAFCYGAAMLNEYVQPEERPAPPLVALQSFTLEKLWDDHAVDAQGRRRIS
jgi:hypothetical protein